MTELKNIPLRRVSYRKAKWMARSLDFIARVQAAGPLTEDAVAALQQYIDCGERILYDAVGAGGGQRLCSGIESHLHILEWRMCVWKGVKS